MTTKENDETGKGKVFSGASGLVLPVPNKALYPPEFQDRSRLEYYAHLFSSIEINSSFYKLPISKTVSKWAEIVPAHFRFTFKLWKQITHNKGLDFDAADVEIFMQRISVAGAKGSCLLIQFPPSLSSDSIMQLDLLLTTVNMFNKNKQWKIAVEFRNRTWYTEEVFELIAKHYASVVIQDLPASATPMQEEMPAFIYLRFHGPNGGYRGSYPDEFLYEYAQYICEWKEEGKEVYVYFNNTMGSAVHNLITLNKYVSDPDH